jgi:SAM-dependent methyltransferase
MSFWDQRFAEPELAYGTEPNDFLREVAGRIPPGPVLCLAEGQGRNAVFLAGLGHEVTALDQSAVGLARARELAQQRGVAIETVQADLAVWDGPRDHWAAVVVIFGHLPPPIRARVHGLIPVWLRPGGVLVMEAYRPEQLGRGTGGPPEASMLYSPDLLRADFPSLRIDRLEAVERDVIEGKYHTGRAATVQLLATRA